MLCFFFLLTLTEPPLTVEYSFMVLSDKPCPSKVLSLVFPVADFSVLAEFFLDGGKVVWCA